MTRRARRILMWAVVGLVIISTIASILTAGFWSRSYWRSDQVAWRRVWCDSWKGRFVIFLDDPAPPQVPRPFSWWSNPSSQDNFGLVNPEGIAFGVQYNTQHGFPTAMVIPYGWVFFLANLPADIIGLIWMFRWSRERDAATGGHLTARVVLYLAAAIPVLLFIMFLLCR